MMPRSASFPSLRTSAAQAVAILAIAIASSTSGLAQGFLIPDDPETPVWRRRPNTTRPVTYAVDKIDVDASLQDSVATVQVAQTFRNECSQTLHVRFVFPMPYDGAIDQMTFLVDGRELPGRLMDADDARQRFAEYVRRMQDPALVQWLGSGMFQTEVFPIPPNAERTVSLRYTQLLRRTGSLTDWLLPLAAADSGSAPVRNLSVRARIRSDAPLANVYSPTHDCDVEKPDATTALVTLKASGKAAAAGDLRLMWDTSEQPVRMSLVGYREDDSEDGYFMLLLQPDLDQAKRSGRDSQGKQLVLVIDKSGSMSGEKIQQARSAADYVLSKLKPRDRFELITYDNRVETYRGQLNPADDKTVADARDYVASMLAGGGTNIHDALQQSLQTAATADGPAYVIFLTDGQPTVGVTEPNKIVAAAKQANDSRARVLSLGVGHDVNSRLLDMMSRALLGQSIYVRPTEAIDQHVQRLWDRIGAPVLSDVRLKITVDGDTGVTRNQYPDQMVDVFSGDQVVVVGRYRRGGKVQIKLTGTLDGQPQTYRFDGRLPDADTGHRTAFVQRLWAVRRIGAILDQIDLGGEHQELIDELVALSKKYGILTPYTAFLADEQVDLNDAVTQRQRAGRYLERLQEQSGQGAFNQRALKTDLGVARTPAAAAEASADFFAGGGFGGSSARAALPADASARGALRPSISGNAPAALPALSGPARADALADRASTTAPMRVIGGRAFFVRGGRLVDSQATPQQVQQATTVQQLSEPYFALLNKVAPHERVWLAQDQPLLVVIQGQAYNIDP